MPTDEDIRLRAYYLFLERKREGRPGSAEDDWRLAEAEPDVSPLNSPAMPPTSLRTPRSVYAPRN